MWYSTSSGGLETNVTERAMSGIAAIAAIPASLACVDCRTNFGTC